MNLVECPKCSHSFVVGAPAVHYATSSAMAKGGFNREGLAKSQSAYCRVLRHPMVITDSIRCVTCRVCIKRLRQHLDAVDAATRAKP